MGWFSSSGTNSNTVGVGKNVPVYNNNSIFGSQNVTNIQATKSTSSVSWWGLAGGILGGGAAGYAVSRYTGTQVRRSQATWW